MRITVFNFYFYENLFFQFSLYNGSITLNVQIAERKMIGFKRWLNFKPTNYSDWSLNHPIQSSVNLSVIKKKEDKKDRYNEVHISSNFSNLLGGARLISIKELSDPSLGCRLFNNSYDERQSRAHALDLSIGQRANDVDKLRAAAR